MLARRLLLSSLALVSVCAAGCTVDPDPKDVPPGETQQPISCPVTLHGPTFHKGDVVGHEVWKAEDSPHVLDENVNVRDGATLEIEPCAVVRLAKDVGIRVAFPITPNRGALIAEGTADRPIRFEGKDGARWSSIRVQAPGTASLVHVTIDGAGGAGAEGSLVVFGDREKETDRGVKLDHVTITKALDVGLKIAGSAGLAAGSTDLVVEGAGGFPVAIGESAIGDVPSGKYTGNGKDTILIEPETRLLESATMHDRGVPYQIGTTPKLDNFVLGGGTTPVTLTIEPGVTIRFLQGTAFEVEHATGTFDASASLVAVGTAEKPITFTSASATPAPGDWRGLWFGGKPRAENRIEHARIEYTGADCGCILVTCSAITSHEGAVIFTQQPPTAFIRDTVIAHASQHGIVQGFDGSSLDFKATNAFEDVAGCAETLPRDPSSSCPKPLPACM